MNSLHRLVAVVPRRAGGPSLISSTASSSLWSSSTSKSPQVLNNNIRGFSTKRGLDAACRLHDVLEEYRQVHYTQEVPRRFKKDIVTAACMVPSLPQQQQQQRQEQEQSQQESQVNGSSSSVEQQTAVVSLEGLHQVLCNIGLEDRLSLKDLQIIFEEEGNERGAIPVDRMVQLL